MAVGIRKVAAHEVHVNGSVLIQAVVELQEGRVINYYTFSGELPLTEWLGGIIEVRDSKAYWNGILLQ